VTRRVFIGALGTETNQFVPFPTGLRGYQEHGIFRGDATKHTPTNFTAPVHTWRQESEKRGWTVVEGLSTFAGPSGTTVRSVYEGFRDEMLAGVKAALPLDAVLINVHGAMVADGYDDCEGDLLARVRAMVGPDVVIGAELDPHNHLTPQMLETANLLIAFKEYPHTDVLERAYELVDLCAAHAEGRVRIVGAAVDCAMIVPLHTSRQPARGLIDRLQAMEGRDGILSISITHGFAWGDVEHMGTQVLVYADGDRAKAQATARRIADELIGMREQLATRMPGIDEALDEALAFDGGPVVLADSADNPGGGAPGDSSFILRRLLDRGIGNAAIGPLWDPVAARIAFDAGEGARLPLRIGGKVGPLSGDPVDATCTVRKVIPDLKMTGLAGTPMDMGDSALVETAGIEIVLTSLRNQAMGTDLFTQLGCDLANKKIVVVKSSQHFYAAFSKIAKHVIYVAAPGVVTSDLSTLPYRKIKRPKWPLA